MAKILVRIVVGDEEHNFLMEEDRFITLKNELNIENINHTFISTIFSWIHYGEPRWIPLFITYLNEFPEKCMSDFKGQSVILQDC